MDFIKQKDAMDCGPSCLAMIAKHYGLQPNIDVIRKKCSLGKAGVSLQVESVFPVAHNEEKVKSTSSCFVLMSFVLLSTWPCVLCQNTKDERLR